MEVKNECKSLNSLSKVIEKAHAICSKILLFEAVGMEEGEVRFFLGCNHVPDHEKQNAYLELVREYDKKTSSKKT
jgi:hypothetical protein